MVAESRLLPVKLAEHEPEVMVAEERQTAVEKEQTEAPEAGAAAFVAAARATPLAIATAARSGARPTTTQRWQQELATSGMTRSPVVLA